MSTSMEESAGNGGTRAATGGEDKSMSDKENAESHQEPKDMDTSDGAETKAQQDKPSAKRKNAVLEDPKPNGASKKPMLGKTSKQLGSTEWWEITDPNCEKPYFYSTKSHKTQWQNPLLEAEPKKKKAKTTGNTPRSVTPNTSAQSQKPKEKTSKQIGDSEWWIINDPAAERPYYYHAKTSKTQWTAPNIPEKQKKPELSDALQSIAKKRDGPSGADKQLRAGRDGGRKVSQPPQSAGKTNKRIGNTDWYVINDTNAGCVYYYNAKTEKTQWSAPAAAMVSEQKRSKQIGNSEWWRIDDPQAERPYYYNTTTQKTQWSPPQIALGDDTAVVSMGKKTSKQLGDSEWWMINDPNAAKVYYYNALTQMTQWQDPRKQGGKSQRPLQKNKPKGKKDSELIDVSDGMSDFDVALINNSLSKCNPKCEAKTRARQLVTDLRKVTQQKGMWMKKYTDAQEQLLNFASNEQKSGSPANPPSIDNLVNPIPNNTALVKEELFKNIEEASRDRLLTALSTSDLRQALSLKAELASPYTSQIIYKFLFQAPLDKAAGDEPEHPSHSAIGSRNRKHKPFGNTDIDLPYPCFKCGLRFDTPKQILTHTKKHTFTRLYPCPKESCDEAFPTKSNMERHSATHGPESKDGNAGFLPSSHSGGGDSSSPSSSSSGDSVSVATDATNENAGAEEEMKNSKEKEDDDEDVSMGQPSVSQDHSSRSSDSSSTNDSAQQPAPLQHDDESNAQTNNGDAADQTNESSNGGHEGDKPRDVEMADIEDTDSKASDVHSNDSENAQLHPPSEETGLLMPAGSDNVDSILSPPQSQKQDLQLKTHNDVSDDTESQNEDENELDIVDNSDSMSPLMDNSGGSQSLEMDGL